MSNAIHDDLLLDILEGIWESKTDLVKFVIEDLEKPMNEDFAVEFQNIDHTWKQVKIDNLVKRALHDALEWTDKDLILQDKILKAFSAE